MYASWIRKLEVREWGLSEELTRLVLPSPDGTPPTLPLHPRELDWQLSETNLSFLSKFLSPHLTTIVIITGRAFLPETAELLLKLPSEVLPVILSAIKLFPPSPRVVCIRLGMEPETRLTEEFSSFALGWGEELQELATNVLLSTQAIVHLMKLPNLWAWSTEQGPPQVADLIRYGVPDGPFSLFPSLKMLHLRGGVALEWLSLFAATKTRTLP